MWSSSPWLVVALVGMVSFGASCSDGTPTEQPLDEEEMPPPPPSDTLPPSQNETFAADLNGMDVVPDPVTTDASGAAEFELSQDQTSLAYRLSVTDIEDVFAAHIHLGAAGEAGEIAVTLFDGDAPAPSGILAEGTISDDEVVASQASTLSDLLDLMRRAEAYVNVHTVPHPAGEIRGQIVPTRGGG